MAEPKGIAHEVRDVDLDVHAAVMSRRVDPEPLRGVADRRHAKAYGAITGAPFEVIEGAGHQLDLEKPEAPTNSVTEFVQSIAG